MNPKGIITFHQSLFLFYKEIMGVKKSLFSSIVITGLKCIQNIQSVAIMKLCFYKPNWVTSQLSIIIENQC